jgi:hypothetical protein
MTYAFNLVTQTDKVDVHELSRNLQLKRFPGFQMLKSSLDDCINSVEEKEHQLQQLKQGGRRSTYSVYPDR